jgi:CMP-N,N'-diacetyllegionaminic acid synthase
MNNLAIIPARSGSKGLKDKNIKLLNGKPLLVYSIEAAKKSGLFNEIFVSTDSEGYAEIAREWGASVPFLRSEELASDTASSWDVVKAAIKQYQVIGRKFDTVALLQPTSPLRTAEDITAGYVTMKEKAANAVVALCEVDHSPLWSNTLPEDLSLTNFINRDSVNKPRQKLPQYYRINGALYIVRTEYLLCSDNLYSDKSFAFIMDKEHSVDIDDEMDFIIADSIMKYRDAASC